MTQLEQLFKVKNIYDIKSEFAPLVQKFFQHIYVPSPLLIEEILNLSDTITHPQIAHNYDLTHQIENYKWFDFEIKQKLNHSNKKDITPSPRIELFFDYEN